MQNGPLLLANSSFNPYCKTSGWQEVRLAVVVLFTDEFNAWYQTLTEADQDRVAFTVGLLEQRGVALPFPYSSAIHGADFALRELRTQSAGAPLRTFYAFDPRRNAVLLIGGDKTGDAHFYTTMVPLAGGIWQQYLRETEQDASQEP